MLKKIPFKVKKLFKDSNLPKKGSKLAAGYDISSYEDCIVPSKGKLLISTGWSISLPEGTYGRIAPRSGLASKKFIDVGAGVIDADYRGEVKVLLFNFSNEDFKINKGDRIAQLIIEKIEDVEMIEVEELSDTLRGEKGFGSTGVKDQY